MIIYNIPNPFKKWGHKKSRLDEKLPLLGTWKCQTVNDIMQDLIRGIEAIRNIKPVSHPIVIIPRSLHDRLLKEAGLI
jgi:hypothetical protein